jgi:small subunit ribosomal protein S16
MLTIRLQRTGRKAHAMFRIVVQDSRRTPSSGKIVAHIGNYDPHNKTSNIDVEKAKFYMEHGSQPSPRVASLFRFNKIEMPKWVEEPSKKTKSIKNLEKLRKNQPKEETPAEEVKAEEAISEATEELVTEEAEKIVEESGVEAVEAKS